MVLKVENLAIGLDDWINRYSLLKMTLVTKLLKLMKNMLVVSLE